MSRMFHVTVRRKNDFHEEFDIPGDSFHSALTRLRSNFGFNAKRIDENGTHADVRRYRLHHAVRCNQTKKDGTVLKYKTLRFSGSVMQVESYDLPSGELVLPLRREDADLPEME